MVVCACDDAGRMMVNHVGTRILESKRVAGVAMTINQVEGVEGKRAHKEIADETVKMKHVLLLHT